MNLTDALHFCEIAEHESAQRLVGWPPDLSSQDGEKLLVWGICASQKSAAQQIHGQELAKDCLTRAIELLHGEYQELAKIHLALCYYRLGEPDNSLLLLKDNFISKKVQFCAYLSLAIIAVEDKNPQKSLQLLGDCERLLDHVSDVARGKYFNHKALALALLSSTDHNEDFRDRAIIEFEAAIFCWNEAPRLQGIALNNLARLYSLADNSDAAHDCVDRAITLSRYSKSLTAQCLDQKAKIWLDESKPSYAIIEVQKALSLIAEGEQRGVIDECLDTLRRCTEPNASPLRDENMPDSQRIFELTEALTKPNDGETAAELIELLARTSDRNKVLPVLRQLVTLTDEFERFVEDYLGRFTPAEVEEISERVS